jgi:hypothetical protein
MNEDGRQDERASENAAQTPEEMLAGHNARVGLVHRYEQEWLQVGRALDWIRKNETYKLKGFTSFRAFLREEFPNISAATAWRWIADVQTYDRIMESESNILDSTGVVETHLYETSRAEPEVQADIFREVADEAAASGNPVTAKTIRKKVIEKGSPSKMKITGQEKPARSRTDNESERNQQAHLLASACRKSALSYCKAMNFEEGFAQQVYNMVLSAARNLEAEEAEDEAIFRQTEESEDVAGGAYVCQQCCTAGATQELDVAPNCSACATPMMWYGDIPDVAALLKSLAQLGDLPEEELISGLEIGDKKTDND